VRKNPAMPPELDAVKRSFFAWGRGHGFARRSHELSWPPGETTVMLELQRSDYSRSYYVNIGIAIADLHEAPVTRFGLADIDLRAAALDSSRDPRLLETSHKELQQLLDLENDLDEDTREAGLIRRLDQLLPILDAASTLDGLRKLYCDGFLTRSLMRKEARALLSEGD
jgi:hypothetical protein